MAESTSGERQTQHHEPLGEGRAKDTPSGRHQRRSTKPESQRHTSKEFGREPRPKPEAKDDSEKSRQSAEQGAKAERRRHRRHTSTSSDSDSEATDGSSDHHRRHHRLSRHSDLPHKRQGPIDYPLDEHRRLTDPKHHADIPLTRHNYHLESRVGHLHKHARPYYLAKATILKMGLRHLSDASAVESNTLPPGIRRFAHYNLHLELERTHAALGIAGTRPDDVGLQEVAEPEPLPPQPTANEGVERISRDELLAALRELLGVNDRPQRQTFPSTQHTTAHEAHIPSNTARVAREAAPKQASPSPARERQERTATTAHGDAQCSLVTRVSGLAEILNRVLSEALGAAARRGASPASASGSRSPLVRRNGDGEDSRSERSTRDASGTFSTRESGHNSAGQSVSSNRASVEADVGQSSSSAQESSGQQAGQSNPSSKRTSANLRTSEPTSSERASSEAHTGKSTSKKAPSTKQHASDPSSSHKHSSAEQEQRQTMTSREARPATICYMSSRRGRTDEGHAWARADEACSGHASDGAAGAAGTFVYGEVPDFGPAEVSPR